MILHVKGLPLTTEGRVVTLALEETTFSWEIAESIWNKQLQTTEKGIILTLGGLASGSELTCHEKMHRDSDWTAPVARLTQWKMDVKFRA
jgi:hypothetical protein